MRPNTNRRTEKGGPPSGTSRRIEGGDGQSVVEKQFARNDFDCRLAIQRGFSSKLSEFQERGFWVGQAVSSSDLESPERGV